MFARYPLYPLSLIDMYCYSGEHSSPLLSFGNLFPTIDKNIYANLGEFVPKGYKLGCRQNKSKSPNSARACTSTKMGGYDPPTIFCQKALFTTARPYRLSPKYSICRYPRSISPDRLLSSREYTGR